MLNRQPGGLVALMAQIDTAFAGLQEFGARLEAIKASAAILHSDLTREVEALREALETSNSKDDNPNRLVPLKEAAKLRGVSLDTLKRTSRDKFIKISDSRYAMRLRDVLLL